MSTSTDGAPPVPRHMQRDRFAPVPETQAARDEPGLTAIRTGFGTPARLVTRYADVREVLGDAERFTNTGLPRLPTPEDGIDPRAGNLLATDPPEHTRLRRLLTGEFTVKRIRRLEPRIVEIVDDHLDAMAAAGPPAELVERLRAAGAEPGDLRAARRPVRRPRRVPGPRGPPARPQPAAGGARAPGRRVARRTWASSSTGRGPSPGDDMLGMLVREHGDDLAAHELIGIAQPAAHRRARDDANMLGLGTLALLRAPEQLALVRDEPGAVAPAIEELLRFLSVVHSGIPRTVRHDTTVGDVPVAAGEVLVLSLPAANRDPAVVEHPDDLDVTRTIAPHVAFGHGVHHCLGAPLARAEMAVAFPALFRRFPTLAPGIPFEEIEFRSATIVHGLRSLPVTW